MSQVLTPEVPRSFWLVSLSKSKMFGIFKAG
jgi:hypothetical protein